MQRLSRTFLTVSIVLCFIAFATLLLFGLALIGFGAGFFPMIAEESKEGGAAYLAGMLAGGFVCLYFAVMALVSGIVSSAARRNPTKKSLIVAIVFSVLSCTWFGVAGGAVGIVAIDKQARRDRQNKIVDAE